jgi:hypothetical protein
LVPGTSTIKICDGSDILGVLVDSAGFVGGQNADIPRDDSYGLVVNSGLVDVRCELDVEVGDYVISNSRGYAEKSSSNFGYRVLHKEEKKGISYVVILLGVQADTTNAIGNEINVIDSRLDAAEINIVSASNTANEAYNKAEEVFESNKNISEAVNNTLEVVDRVVADVEGISKEACNSALLSSQAKALSESAATAALSMRDEAIKKADEALASTSELRSELNLKTIEMTAKIDKVSLEMQATKEDLDITNKQWQSDLDDIRTQVDANKDDIVKTRDDLSKNLFDIEKDVESLVDDLTPLVTWPEGSTGDQVKGIAGFVAKADEDSVTLGNLVAWKDGTGTDSLAGFVSKATSENAEIQALASYKYTDSKGVEHKSVAALDAYAKDNEASIELIAGFDGDIASIQARIDETEASVTTLASHVIGDYISVDTWSTEDKNTKKIYYAEDTKYYWYYDNGWKFTNKSYETKPPLTGALAGIQQVTDNNSASIEMITSLEGEFGEAVSSFAQDATKENATVKAIASYQKKDEDGNPYGPSGASVLMSQVDANTASINLLTELEGEGYSGLAGLVAKVDSNTSSITTLASHVVGDFENTDDWTEDGKDINVVYYAKNRGTYYYYSQSDQKWHGTTKAYEAGLSGSVANVQQTADENKASIEMISALEGDFGNSLSGFVAEATAENAEIKALAQYNGGAAGLISTVNDHESKVETIATLNSDVAGLQAQVLDNKSTIDVVASHVSGKYTVVDSWSAAGKDTNIVYYARDIKRYWYYDNGWRNSTNAYDVGLPASVGVIQVETDENNSRINQLTTWQGNTNTAMARIEQKADSNGAYIQSTVSNIDKYAVGPYSQAYGFTLEQAASIIQEGMIYVPTTSHEEEYQYTDANNNVQTYKRSFTPQYLYKWGIVNGQYRWITVDKNYTETSETNTSAKAVYFTATEPAVSGNFGYWYTNGDVITGTTGTYEPYTLYKWQSYVDDSNVTYYYWIPVATLAGNSQIRAVSQIRQDANSIVAEVTNVRGDVASLGVRVGNTETEVQSLASWTKDKDGNQYNLATIQQTANDAGASIAQVVEAVGKDGEVNAASIVTAVTEDESSIALLADNISLNADQIDFTAGDFIISADNIEFNGQKLNIKVDSSNIEGTLTIGQLPESVAETDDIPTDAEIVTISKGAITADFIRTLDLEVGDEIKMGENATISWNNVTGKDDVATTDKVTQITRNEISTATINADQINVNGDLKSFGADIGGWGITDNAIESDTVRLYSSSTELLPSLVTSGTDSSIRIRVNPEGGWIQTNFETIDLPYSPGDNYNFYFTPEIPADKIISTSIKVVEVNSSSTTIKGTQLVGNNINVYYSNGDCTATISYSYASDDSTFCVLEDGSLYAEAMHVTGRGIKMPHGSNATILLPNKLQRSYMNSGEERIEECSWKNLISTINNSTSDSRAKNSIESLPEQYDIFFDQLKPKRYKYNDGTSGRYHTGYIAQEVVEALENSGLSTTDFAAVMLENPSTDDEVWRLRRDEFVALNTWQIQKLKSRIDELEKKIEELTNKMANL